MKKAFGKFFAAVIASAMILNPLLSDSGISIKAEAHGVADYFAIPEADENGFIGAKMPYTRYDSRDASIGGGASLAASPDFAKKNIASQASEQSYVNLPSNGSYAEWTASTNGAGVTMRFTMPDTGDGMGQEGSLDFYVNGRKVKTVDLTSYYMWQYFASGNPSDTNDGGAPCFAFDEVHFLLDTEIKIGDKIKVQSTRANNLEYGIDFIEIEAVPEAIEQPANSVNVEDFGASPDDGKDDYNAIYAAIEYADSNNMDVYIPAGTFEIGQTWRLYGSDMKITGAGMWYTNIQFTNPNRGGGGISGGWQTQGAKDGYCRNIEFCNMYINSNLRSRYNQEAVYKCFMDVYTDGSVIHDVWEEHFECGFWFGDYNGKMDYSDGIKVVNCRIRNNLADGVNFCQGTSNAVVYNCSIRNNGDDGLAMWNNTYGNAKDETDNVFCYNTIEFIWRAGGIAIYGGSGHKIYNNYLSDMFMAAGIHLNTTFDGYKFTNNKGISFDNNVLVRCGTSSDSWNEELGAVDVKQAVTGVTFNNTYIYDAQHEGIRILDNSCSNIIFNNTKIFGAGVDSQRANYSSVYHEGAAIRVGGEGAIFNGLEICNVAWKGENAPYFITGGVNPTFRNVTIYDDDTSYELPSLPSPTNTNPGGGVVDPLEGVSGYNLKVVGLSWKNESGATKLDNGNKVTFETAIKNDSGVDIPEGVVIGVKVTVDGKGSYTNTSYKGGLKAGQIVKIDSNATWSAVKGGHTFLATVDYQNKLNKETNESDNTRIKNVNVNDVPVNTSFTRVNGGYDLIITDVTYGKETIAENENLLFTATVVNRGDKDIPAGTVIGVSFKMDDSDTAVTWSDTYASGLRAGSSVSLTANSGMSGKTLKATSGAHTVTAWVDDVNRLTGEVNEDNNQKIITITVPYAGIVYFNNPDGADDLSNLNNITIKDPEWNPVENPGENQEQGNSGNINPPIVEPQQPTDYTKVYGGYDLYVTEVITSTTEANKAVTFTAKVVNAGDRDIPAGTVIGAQFQVDGVTNAYTWSDSYNGGLKAGEYVLLTANGGTNGSTWFANAGTHSVTAWVDDVNRLTAEINENNNRTTKQFTFIASANTNTNTNTNTGNSGNNNQSVTNPTDYVKVYGGYDLFVTDITYDTTNLRQGRNIIFTAKVVNAGDRDIPAGTVIGVQFQIDGQTNVITWCDSYSSGLKAGEYVLLTANGGTNGKAWTAVRGNHSVTAWVDDVNRLSGEVNENNNIKTTNITIK